MNTDYKYIGDVSKELTTQAKNSSGGVYYMGYQTNVEKEELKRIELAARTCYKSEGNITEDSSSAVSLFQKLVSLKHYAMLRFGERTVGISSKLWSEIKVYLDKYSQIQYWRVSNSFSSKKVIITANLQCWLFLAKIIVIEYKVLINDGHGNCCLNNLSLLYNVIKDIFKEWPIVWSILSLEFGSLSETFELDNKSFGDYWVEVDIEKDIVSSPEYKGLLRHTFRVVTDRGISHEIVRHTTLNYAQESTRYVSYAGNNVDDLVWVPEHLREHPSFNGKLGSFQYYMKLCLNAYKEWRDKSNLNKLSPSDARNFLPHCLKTELVISGYIDISPAGSEFNLGLSHFIDMRYSKNAHKGIQQIAREIAKHVNYTSV